MLLELLRDVEAFAGEPASRAVLAVPAYFDDEQRAATPRRRRSPASAG